MDLGVLGDFGVRVSLFLDDLGVLAKADSLAVKRNKDMYFTILSCTDFSINCEMIAAIHICTQISFFLIFVVVVSLNYYYYQHKSLNTCHDYKLLFSIGPF